MRTHAWFSPVSLLTLLFLLSAVPALAHPHGSMDGDFKKISSRSSHHGASGVGPKGYHGKADGADEYQKNYRQKHEGAQKGHGYGSMHSSGYGKAHAKGYGKGYGSTHPGHHQNAMNYIEHILKFKEGMNLTDEQEQQLQALKTDYKRTRVKTKAEVELAMIDLHEVLKNEQSSLSDVEAQFNNLHALKTKLYMASIKAKRDAKAALSDEQRSRMDTIHERIKAHGGSMGHSGDYSKKYKNGHGKKGYDE